jgi:hypothetical protein
MRFPNPVAVACLTCGQPTVAAETSTGSLRMHCGTWRWQCDIPASDIPLTDRYAVTSAGLSSLDAVSEQALAA